jgi:hypothetical protein
MVAYLIAGPDGTKPAPITPALPSEATA